MLHNNRDITVYLILQKGFEEKELKLLHFELLVVIRLISYFLIQTNRKVMLLGSNL